MFSKICEWVKRKKGKMLNISSNIRRKKGGKRKWK